MLSKVKQVLEKHCKTLKALVIFGSHVYSPPRSRDIDILVVVDGLDNAKEKKLIELEILKNLRSLDSLINLGSCGEVCRLVIVYN